MGKVIEKIVPIQTQGVPFYTIESVGSSLTITHLTNGAINYVINGISFADPIWYFDVNKTAVELTENTGYNFVVVLKLKFLDNTFCTKTFTFGDELFGVLGGAFSSGFSNGFSIS